MTHSIHISGLEIPRATKSLRQSPQLSQHDIGAYSRRSFDTTSLWIDTYLSSVAWTLTYSVLGVAAGGVSRADGSVASVNYMVFVVLNLPSTFTVLTLGHMGHCRFGNRGYSCKFGFDGSHRYLLLCIPTV